MAQPGACSRLMGDCSSPASFERCDSHLRWRPTGLANHRYLLLIRSREGFTGYQGILPGSKHMRALLAAVIMMIILPAFAERGQDTYDAIQKKRDDAQKMASGG